MPIEIIVNAALVSKHAMAAQTSPMLGVNPKLYRHFAIGTIAVAVIVAVFSSGETQDAIAKNQQQIAMKKADEAKFGKTRLVDNRDDRVKQSIESGGFGAEPSAPMIIDSPGNSGGDAMATDFGPPKMPVIIEPNQAMMAKMNADERKAYLKALEDDARKRAAKGPYVPTKAQLAALDEASAARAGPPSTD